MCSTPTLHSLACLFFAAAAPLAHGQILSDWQFNDTAGTELKDTANSVSGAPSWNFNISNPTAEGATDGTGNFYLGASVAAGTTQISKDYTRDAEFASTLGSGVYVLEFRISDWQLSTANSFGIALNIEDTGNSNSLKTRFISNNAATDTRIRVVQSGNAAQQLGFGDAGTDTLTVRTTLDLTGQTFKTEAQIGTGIFTEIVPETAIDGTFTGVDRIRLEIEGDDGSTVGWSNGDFITIDYISFTQIPEPSTSGLLMLALSGLCLWHRRRSH